MKTRLLPAAVITAFLIILCAASLIYLLLPDSGGRYIADIYQQGELLMSIPLSDVEEPYSFFVEGENGCLNEVEVRPGSIGIISADCPDRLCVRQGFLSDSGLPITCLPNRLVIRLRPEPSPSGDTVTPDAVTY